MGSITGHKIDYNGAGALRGQRHIPSKTKPKSVPAVPADYHRLSFYTEAMASIKVNNKFSSPINGHKYFLVFVRALVAFRS